MFDDPLSQFSQDPGSVGDVARGINSNPPAAKESPWSYENRIADEAAAQQADAVKQAQLAQKASSDQQRQTKQADTTAKKIRRATVKEFQSQGMAAFDAGDKVDVVKDAAGAPLTNFDTKSSIGYDSSGAPQRVSWEHHLFGETTRPTPKVEDPYAGAPEKIDKRDGSVYLAPDGQPWRPTGKTDPATAQSLQDKAAAQAASALSTQAAIANRDATVLGKQIKETKAGLSAEIPDAVAAPDFKTAQAAIDARFNEEYAAPAANQTLGWFGSGELTPAAKAIRADIDARKAKANSDMGWLTEANERHSALLGEMAKRRSAAAALKNAAAEKQLADAREKGVVIPGIDGGPVIDGAVTVEPSEQPSEAPAATLFAPTEPAYRVDQASGSVAFDPARLEDGILEAFQGGVIDKAKFQDLLPKAQAAAKAIAEQKAMLADDGIAGKLRALGYGAGKGGVFLAGAIPGAQGGAALGALTGPAAPIAVPVASAIGGLITGGLASWGADKLARKIADHSDIVKSFTDSADAHPILDAAGNLIAFGSALPKTIANLSGDAAIRLASGASKATVAKALATRVGGYAAANVGIDTILKEGGKALGFSDEGQTLPGAAQAALIGAFFSGHGITFKNYGPEEVGAILTKYRQAVSANRPPEQVLRPEELEVVDAAAAEIRKRLATGTSSPDSTVSVKQAQVGGKNYGVSAATTERPAVAAETSNAPSRPNAALQDRLQPDAPSGEQPLRQTASQSVSAAIPGNRQGLSSEPSSTDILPGSGSQVSKSDQPDDFIPGLTVENGGSGGEFPHLSENATATPNVEQPPAASLPQAGESSAQPENLGESPAGAAEVDTAALTSERARLLEELKHEPGSQLHGELQKLQRGRVREIDAMIEQAKTPAVVEKPAPGLASVQEPDAPAQAPAPEIVSRLNAPAQPLEVTAYHGGTLSGEIDPTRGKPIPGKAQGVYFSPDLKEAEKAVTRTGNGSKVHEATLRLNNPATVISGNNTGPVFDEARKIATAAGRNSITSQDITDGAKALGHDSIVYKYGPGNTKSEYVVFDKGQVEMKPSEPVQPVATKAPEVAPVVPPPPSKPPVTTAKAAPEPEPQRAWGDLTTADKGSPIEWKTGKRGTLVSVTGKTAVWKLPNGQTIIAPNKDAARIISPTPNEAPTSTQQETAALGSANPQQPQSVPVGTAEPRSGTLVAEQRRGSEASDRGRAAALIEQGRKASGETIDRLTALGIETSEGPAGTGGWSIDRGNLRILHDSKVIDEAAQYLQDRGHDPQKWAKAAYSEESIHALDAAASGDQFTAIHAKIWHALPKETRDAVRKVYPTLDRQFKEATAHDQAGRMSLASKMYRDGWTTGAAEYVRMLTQFRRGEPITEQTFGRDVSGLEKVLDREQPKVAEEHWATMESVVSVPLETTAPAKIAPKSEAPATNEKQEPTTERGPPTLDAASPRPDENGVHSLAKPSESANLSAYERQRDPASILDQLVRDRQTADRGQRWKHGRPIASHSGLVTWATGANRTIEPAEISSHKPIGGGGEHSVLVGPDGRIWKLTKPGLYGANGEDAGAYLQRWALANRVFGDNARLEGLVKLPGEDDYRAVVSQSFVEGRDATPAEITEYLNSKGFRDAGDGRWVHPVTGVTARDVITPGNVIMQPNGEAKVIDLPIEPSSAEELAQVREESGIGGESLFAADPKQADLAESKASTGTLTPEEALLVGHIIPMQWRRLYEGAADTLKRTESTKPLGEAVEKYIDRDRELSAKISTPFREWSERFPKAEQNTAKEEWKKFAGEYDRGPDGRLGAEEYYKTMSKAGQELLDTFDTMANRMADYSIKIGMQTKDSNGKWRAMRKVEGRYFPRTINPEFLNAIYDPSGNPKAWREVLKIMKDAGHGKTDAEVVAQFRKAGFSPESRTDLFSSLERARELKLPARLYDYSFNAALRYMRAFSGRVSQVEAFGQDLGADHPDLFGKFIGETYDRKTQEFMAAVRDRVYGVSPRTMGYRALQVLNSVATGTQLSNPVTGMANLIGGMIDSAHMFGAANVAAGVKEVASLKGLADAIRNAKEIGVLHDDIMDLAHDADALGSNFVSKVSEAAGAALKYTGYNAIEAVNRSVSLVAAKAFIRQMIKERGLDSSSRKSKAFEEFLKKNNVDPVKIFKEGGAGPESNRFYRSAVNEAQGGYRIDQVPPWIDSPIGRFLFKYQKWGVQQTRLFMRRAVDPAQKFIASKGKEGTMVPLLRYFLLTAAAGLTLEQLRQTLFGTPQRTASLEEIQRTATEDQKRAWVLAGQKLWMGMMNSGAGGLISNYAQSLTDVFERSRFKSPLSPPGVSSITNAGELLFRAIEQHELTAKDLDDYVSSQLSLYRTTKGAAARAADTAGTKLLANEQSRQDQSWLGVRTRRFAEEVGIEASRTSMGRVGKTPLSPAKRDVLDALRAGDLPAAKAALKTFTDDLPKEAREGALKSLAASVRASQPVKVGAAGEARRELFLDWAKRRLPAAEVAKIMEIDKRYRDTAARVGLFDPKPVTPAKLEVAKTKLSIPTRPAAKPALPNWFG